MPLHDGQQVALRGTLIMRPAGRLQFAAVRTVQAYLPVVAGADVKSRSTPVHEVGLSGYRDYRVLYAHRGQPVTITGTLKTDGASPYYLHSVTLSVVSMRLADGTELKGTPRTASRLAVDVGDYQATAVLPASLAKPWQYSAHGAPDPNRRFLFCSSNGGGDVVNCSCATGFKAIHAESPTSDVSSKIFDDSGTAQFGVGDGARRVDLAVTCSR